MQKREGKAIPTPTVSIWSNFKPAENFVQPSTYIRYKAVEINEEILYDVDSQDLKWLEKFNDGKLNILSVEVYEASIDFFEKEQGFNQETILTYPHSKKFDNDVLSLASPVQFLAVYNFWKTRRYCKVKRGYPLGKPLLHVFEHPPDSGDIQQPFHRREAGKPTTRGIVREKLSNTPERYRELLTQRKLLSKALDALQLIHRREKLKRSYFRNQFRLWNLHHGECASLVHQDITFSEHVSRLFGPNDRFAQDLSKIQDLDQFLEMCKSVGFPVHQFQIRLRPSRAVAPPQATLTPRFGRAGQLLWPRFDASEECERQLKHQKISPVA